MLISMFIFLIGPNRPSLSKNANVGPTSVTISWGAPSRTKTPVLGYKASCTELLAIVLSNIDRVSLLRLSFCSNTGLIGDDPYWTSRKNSLELTEPSSINEVSLV